MKKEYLLIVTRDEEDKLHMESKNDGFTGFEILGFLGFKQQDIINQLTKQVKPDEIKRQVVID